MHKKREQPILTMITDRKKKKKKKSAKSKSPYIWKPSLPLIGRLATFNEADLLYFFFNGSLIMVTRPQTAFKIHDIWREILQTVSLKRSLFATITSNKREASGC